MNKLLITLAFIGLWMNSIGQSISEPQKVPMHPDVVSGELENGLKYFILKNEKPKEKVEMRLAINAGSILERDDQQGLAHFCEHMAFNGTKNFEKNELISTLQANGVKFGAHLNAYTSFDETVYMLSLPTKDSLLDIGYQILEDWAHQLSFDSSEIEKERGVVLEEYRIGMGANKRMLAQYLPIMLCSSDYVKRLPIGQKEVLDTFDHQSIKDFYETWYRPNLMSVIIVGDINVLEAENQIKKHFTSIQNPKNLLERKAAVVPDHKETKIAKTTDPEATNAQVRIMYKRVGTSKKLGIVEEYRSDFVEYLYATMLNNRLRKKGEEVGAPFSYAYGYNGGTWARGKEAFTSFAYVNGTSYLEALSSMVIETERVKQHGFTETELARAKQELKASLERGIKEKGKTESGRIARGLVSYFLENEPFTDPEFDMQIFNKYTTNVNLNRVNSFSSQYFGKQNRVVIMTGPEKDKTKMPSDEEIINRIEKIENSKLEAYEEAKLRKEIMARPTNKTTVLLTNYDEQTNVQSITLSNGIKIKCLNTDFKNDQILFRAVSKGGTNVLSDKEYDQIKHIKGSINQSGVADLSKIDLEQILAGKSAYVNANMGNFSESLRGSCRPQDLESMLQLVYLKFTKPRFDEEAYKRFVERSKAMNLNRMANPQLYYKMKWYDHIIEGERGFTNIPTERDWQESNYEVLEKVYKQRFADPGDFEFIFVGNISDDGNEEGENSFVQLLLSYLGSLPELSEHEPEKFGKMNYKYNATGDELVIKKGTDEKSTVDIFFSSKVNYSPEKVLHANLLAEVLKIQMTEKLREEMSGVYGSSARAYISRDFINLSNLSMSYPCGPENVDTLIEATLALLERIKKEGVSQENLDKVKKTKITSVTTSTQSNRFWLERLVEHVLYNDEVFQMEDYQELIKSVTSEDLVNMAKALTEENPVIIGKLFPEDWE